MYYQEKQNIKLSENSEVAEQQSHIIRYGFIFIYNITVCIRSLNLIKTIREKDEFEG